MSAEHEPRGLDAVIDLATHAIGDSAYSSACRAEFEKRGVLVLDAFLTDRALQESVDEANQVRSLAYFSADAHTVYLEPPDLAYPDDDARSRSIVSTKGAVTTDQVPLGSHLRAIYDSPLFRGFLCEVLQETALFEYSDPLSSINVNFYEEGQELGWHFDNSEFAVTLLLQNPTGGGSFEFVEDMREADGGGNNEREVTEVLDGSGHTPDRSAVGLSVSAGSLVLFRGRDALHRVTAIEGDTTRILVVLAYNTEPGLSLSESARRTFFGRLE